MPLYKRSDITFKMVIPEEVERKIRLLCREIHNIEWSGVLFYDITGTFEDHNLVIICKDVYQMDIGNGTYTEYTMNPSVATYMLDHDLMGCYQGHIHSHHNMATFFSGTDTQELKDGGNGTNHFVSLIVNNAGKYTAAITRKIKSTRNIIEDYNYNSFNDVLKVESRQYSESTEYLEYYHLDIDIKGEIIPFEEEMLNRIKEIREEKNKSKGFSQYVSKDNIGNYEFPKEKAYNTIMPTSIQKTLPFEEMGDIPYGIVKIDPKIIQSLVKQLVTCSIIIPSESSIDVLKWVKGMNNLYTKRFGDIKNFKEFAANYVDYLINYTYDEKLMEVLDATDMCCIIAYETMKELSKYPKNPWLNVYIELLEENIL